jgi:SAM-dependent methyltransferase
MFIPLGHLAGRLMTRLPRLPGYALNLLGSLAGIGLFFLLSVAWTAPSVWLGVAALLAAPFLIGHRRTTAVAVGSIAVMLVAVGLMESRRREHVFYSPYQVIALQLPDAADAVPTSNVRVNHCFYQEILDCGPEATARSERNARGAEYYNLPYRLGGEPGDVLVVGAGSGNDVAAALRNGAHSVTAVEIDPAIAFLGRHLHPERPYQNSRTRQVTNDARTFLRTTGDQFDTVIYGLLDSHTNLGAMTNVRLDSFVYTVEGFREALARLTQNGLLFVSYTVLDKSQGDKLYAMLRAVYPDRLPRAFRSEVQNSTIFVTGPGLSRLTMGPDGVDEVTAAFKGLPDDTELATDDWPFFYMRGRSYPLSYALMIGLLFGLSCLLVRKQLGKPRLQSARQGTFFFLGAGFMLVETKAVTELGLVFGNTWSVSAVAVTGILVMVFLANLWVQVRGPVTASKAFALLGGCLLIGWLLTRLPRFDLGIPLPQLMLPMVLTMPLYFAGLIFSSELAQGGDLGEALSANLFGAMLGGFLEYNSMYWGLSSLYPLGMALYALAFLCHLMVQRAGSRQRLEGPTIHEPFLPIPRVSRPRGADTTPLAEERAAG